MKSIIFVYLQFVYVQGRFGAGSEVFIFRIRVSVFTKQNLTPEWIEISFVNFSKTKKKKKKLHLAVIKKYLLI